MYADKDYIVQIRREIHRYPEVGFELPKTIALVKRELDRIGIAYTEKYGRSSVVATINPKKTGFTIGIRADMDALLIEEKNDVEYRSRIKGQMHACGHDAHTAMLLGTAKALNERKESLDCCVKLLFQPSEEGAQSGAELMVKDGVMNDIDVIIALHVENALPVGKIGVCKGASQASCRDFHVEFFGETAHAALPHSGVDAIASAVRTYNNIQYMLGREMNPFSKYICSVGKLEGGTSPNTIADYAHMLGTIRTFDLKVDEFLIRRITEIAENTAHEIGAKTKIDTALRVGTVYNNPYLSDLLTDSAARLLGKESIAPMQEKLASEDFANYLIKKPGVLFRLGTANLEKGIISLVHNNDFQLDEDALPIGTDVCVQFVLDHGHGISKEKIEASEER